MANRYAFVVVSIKFVYEINGCVFCFVSFRFLFILSSSLLFSRLFTCNQIDCFPLHLLVLIHMYQLLVVFFFRLGVLFIKQNVWHSYTRRNFSHLPIIFFIVHTIRKDFVHCSYNCHIQTTQTQAHTAIQSTYVCARVFMSACMKKRATDANERDTG